MGSATLTAPLYRSARNYDFQAEGAAHVYLRDNNLSIWSTGLGKGHLAMMGSALLFEDDMIDHVVLVAEGDKVIEWLNDFAFFTDIEAKAYRGEPDRRRRIASELPPVIVGTYETYRNDLAIKRKGSPRALDDGFLTTALRGQRVLFVYDEITKLKNRTSAIYKHHEYVLRQLRKVAGNVRTLGLTATPIERDPENVFNIGRLISPGFCTVEQFEADHVLARDEYGRVVKFINIGPDDHIDPEVTTLFGKLEHCLLVKDKFDDDVRSEFPQQVEEFDFVPIEGKLREFYDAILELSEEDEGASTSMALNTVLRQVLLHPMSLTLSNGSFAKQIVNEVGVAGLSAIPTPRLDRLLGHLEPIVKGEGRQAVVFSFFGQSVLPLLKEALEAAEYRVAYNTGGLRRSDRDEAQRAFKAGEADIFLSSDAGSRGINLSQATYVENYELPRLAATYEQRINRAHRIDSEASLVLARSMIALGTIEETMARDMLERNQWFDTFIQAGLAAGTYNPHRPSAAERRLLVGTAKTQGDDEA